MKNNNTDTTYSNNNNNNNDESSLQLVGVTYPTSTHKSSNVIQHGESCKLWVSGIFHKDHKQNEKTNNGKKIYVLMLQT